MTIDARSIAARIRASIDAVAAAGFRPVVTVTRSGDVRVEGLATIKHANDGSGLDAADLSAADKIDAISGVGSGEGVG